VPVADGEYSYEFILDEGDEVFNVIDASIIIDSTPPTASMSLSDDVYFLDTKNQKITNDIKISISCDDENGIDYSRSFLTVTNFNGKEVKTFDFHEGFPDEVIWDGIDDTYNIALPAGNYKVVLSVFDIAGNMTQIMAELLIVTQPTPAQEVEISSKNVSQDQGSDENHITAPKPVAKVIEKAAPKVVKESVFAKTRLHKIQFDKGSDQLSDKSKQTLRELAKYLKANPKIKIAIDGYIDPVQEELQVESLASNRAKTVKTYLIDQSIQPSRMTTHAHQPQTADNSYKGYPKNRRTEILILK
jgi:outer membrane protein OmpA-like peptidoglycan-associated protein